MCFNFFLNLKRQSRTTNYDPWTSIKEKTHRHNFKNNHMVRTKTHTYNRPASTPSIAFERFKEGEAGGSDEAVVYFQENGLMQHNKTKQYYAPCNEDEFPEDTQITEVFITKKGNLLIIKYKDTDGDNVQMVCSPVVVPDSEQKVKITALVQTTGSKLVEEVEAIRECIKRIKTLTGTLNTEVLSMCPGFTLAALDEDTEFDLPMKEPGEEVDTLECSCTTMYCEYKALSVAEPFSKKRKADE